MNTTRYILEPYKGMNTRYICPSCQQKAKSFSRYIDTVTGEQINSSVGRCNRESSCGYHYTPKQYFQDNNISTEKKLFIPVVPPGDVKPTSFIDKESFQSSLGFNKQNNFFHYLETLFGTDTATALAERYQIGTSSHWKGSTVFWQIDSIGKVRTGKIMLYNPETGRRVKEPFSHITWSHTALNLYDYQLKQCLFGEHLLVDGTLPVAIVESEKTAVIASVYLPELLWLAVGSLTNLSAEKCSILKGRTVLLFPDLGGFEKWSSKAKELSHITKFKISDLLERQASEAEKKNGFDLADYLTRFDYKQFRKPAPISEPVPEQKQKPVVILSPVRPIIRTENEVNVSTLYGTHKEIPLFDTNPAPWDITELESFFASAKLPTEPFKLNPSTTVTDALKFFESNMATVKRYNGNRTFKSYYNRLIELQRYLSERLN